MAGTIIDEIKESFRKGSILTKLIYINLGIFIIVNLVFVIYTLFTAGQIPLGDKKAVFENEYLTYMMVPSDLTLLIHRPWTVFTYMFLHSGFIHILFNLVVLLWFGRIFLHYLTEKQLLTTYIIGGLAGAFLFILSYNIFPGLTDAQALGASASIMAIVTAISFYSPDYTVYIPFIGPTKIKYIAIVYFLLDIMFIASENAGGHIAHLGGFMYGYFFAIQLKRGKDIGKGFSRIFDSIASFFKPRPKMKVSYKNSAKEMNDLDYNKSKAENQKEIDRILDKIAQSGYDSLSKKEKETLFKMSK